MKNHTSTSKRLLYYIKPYWHMGLCGIIGTILYAGIDSGAIYMLKHLLNKGFIERDIAFIHWVPIIIFFAFSMRGISSFVSSFCMTWVARIIVMILRQQLFHHYLHMPASAHDQISSGKLLSKLLYDAEQVAQTSMDALTIFLQSFCFVGGLIVVMFVISWQLTLIYCLVVPIIAVIVKVTNRKIRRYSLAIQKTMMNVTEIAEEAIEGYKVVKIFGGENYENDKFKVASKLNFKQDMKASVVKSLNVSGVQLIAAMGIAFIVYFAILPGSVTSLSAGSFASLVAAMLAILKPLKQLTTVNSIIQRGLAGAQSIFEMLDSEVEKSEGIIKIKHYTGLIEFKNVCFKYPSSPHEVLKNINFTVNPGEIIALVGHSGSGKTTLVNLIPKFYIALSGKILIDGIELNQLDLKTLRSHISFVGQNITLFNDTILNNIAYSTVQKPDYKKAYEAACKAHAVEFIEQLPDKFNTHIGENGILLSGGQRQRLAIARAIYKEAPILILDEATSSLDSNSERYIQEALEEVMYHRTTLVIAHRLSTIERANKIIVMHKGMIVEIGTHQELLASNLHYAELYKMQFADKKHVTR